MLLRCRVGQCCTPSRFRPEAVNTLGPLMGVPSITRSREGEFPTSGANRCRAVPETAHAFPLRSYLQLRLVDRWEISGGCARQRHCGHRPAESREKTAIAANLLLGLASRAVERSSQAQAVFVDNGGDRLLGVQMEQAFAWCVKERLFIRASRKIWWFAESTGQSSKRQLTGT